ncbi:MAG: hypothetical protein ACTH6O_00620 [Vibrio toranzoniae]
MTIESKPIQVKMAKATEQDFENTYKIIQSAQGLEQNNVFSEGWDAHFAPELTDSEKRQINALANRFERHSPSLWRVIGCAQTLMSEINGVIDHNQDVLDFSPQLKRQHELVTLVEEEDFLSKLKGPMRGEYSIEVTKTCGECDVNGASDFCEVCGGEITYMETVTVDWTTQKQIITDALQHLGFCIVSEGYVA